jgi:hypothetical protein
MWMAVVGSALYTAILLMVALTAIRLINRKKLKRKEITALKGIESGICERLHAANPGSRWRWICRPVGYAANGGIARIEVVESLGKVRFLDVCLMVNGYLVLHESSVAELDASNVKLTQKGAHISYVPKTGIKPNDKESIIKWYNIVLIDALNALINDLNAKGEVCLYINQAGNAYVEENDEANIVYNFGEMPDVTLWEHITEKLGEVSLFAEVQEGNRLFISWA